MGQQAEKKTKRVTGLGRKTRQERVKWNQTTVLRFQTWGRHQTSPASLQVDQHRDCFKGNTEENVWGGADLMWSFPSMEIPSWFKGILPLRNLRELYVVNKKSYAHFKPVVIVIFLLCLRPHIRNVSQSTRRKPSIRLSSLPNHQPSVRLSNLPNHFFTLGESS